MKKFLIVSLCIYGVTNLVLVCAGLSDRAYEINNRVVRDCSSSYSPKIGMFFPGFKIGCWLGEPY